MPAPVYLGRTRTMAHRISFVTLSAICTLAVLLSAPVPTRAASTPPAPITVCLDPGHGGSPNPSNPSQPYDSGAIGLNGLEEKNLTLAVGLRVRTLLEQDGVHVVMTRTTDTDPSIYQREETCVRAKAALFVSIHFNSFTTPQPEGALVLYPNTSDIPFANTMERAIVTGLGPWHIANDGIQFDGDWWTHAPMPQVTVESAYVSNPHDAALLATPAFLNADAAAIRSGIEAYDPAILRLKPSILAWRATHHEVQQASTAATPAAPSAASTSWNPFLLLLLLFSAGGAVLLLRARLRSAGNGRTKSARRHSGSASSRPAMRQERELLGSRHAAHLRSRQSGVPPTGRTR